MVQVSVVKGVTVVKCVAPSVLVIPNAGVFLGGDHNAYRCKLCFAFVPRQKNSLIELFNKPTCSNGQKSRCCSGYGFHEHCNSSFFIKGLGGEWPALAFIKWGWLQVCGRVFVAPVRNFNMLLSMTAQFMDGLAMDGLAMEGLT